MNIPTSPAPLDIRLLGGLLVQVAGAPLPKLRSRQGYRLLALLALRHERAVERTFLARTLWPDTSEGNALAHLRRTLTDLRTALGTAADRLTAPNRHTLRLDMEAPARLDTREFEQAAAAATESADPGERDKAIALYTGPLLEGYTDDWLRAERSRLEQLYDGLRQARPGSAAPVAEAAAAPRPQPAPDRGDKGNARRGSLPLYTNRFVGRTKEGDTLRRLLQNSEKRLITITGTGGTGKTRLAVQVADSLRQRFAGGLFFVPLSDLVSPLLLPQSVANALGLTVGGAGSLVERIAAFLSNSPTDTVPRLLLIDNCEHLLHVSDGSADRNGIAPFLADLLEKTAPNLTILATSRQALHLPGERTFPLKPLPAATTPGCTGDTGVTGIADSTLLFRERAREAQAGAADAWQSERHTALIGEICDALDGLPLAIEIAASWTALLSPLQIRERLQRPDGGQGDVLVHRRHAGTTPRKPTGGNGRHHSLQATLEGSFLLLAPVPAALFAVLSVFRGGWDLEAAEALYGVATEAAGEEADLLPALYVLSELQERSLVVVEAAGGEDGDLPPPRYRFLETIRSFARGKREQEPALARRAAERHAAYYAALAAQAFPHLRQGPQQTEWLNRLKREVNNLRAALDWFQGRGDNPNALLTLCSHLQGYWEATGSLAEGYTYMAAALSKETNEAAGATPDLVRAQVSSNAGSFAWQRGEYSAARAHYEEAQALCVALGEQGLLANVLTGLANVTYYEGDRDAALPLYEQSLHLARQIGDGPRIALALGNLGVFAEQRGDYARAIVLFEEQLALRRTIGNPSRIAITLSNLATSLNSNGQKEEAQAAFAEAEAIFRALGFRTHLPYVLRMRGVMAREAGEMPVAEARLREAITLEHEADLKNDLLESLTEYALLRALTHAPETAARLLGAVTAARERLGFTPLSAERSGAVFDHCARTLGAEATQALCYQGQLLPLDAAVTAALR